MGDLSDDELRFRRIMQTGDPDECRAAFCNRHGPVYAVPSGHMARDEECTCWYGQTLCGQIDDLGVAAEDVARAMLNTPPGRVLRRFISALS